MEFLKAKFDNISLFVMILIMLLAMLHMSHHSVDTPIITWMEQTLTTVLGAYIGLTQANRIAQKSNGNGGTPNVVSK